MTRVFSIVVCTFWAAASVFGAEAVAEGGSLLFAVDLREAVAAEGLPLMLTDGSVEIDWSPKLPPEEAARRIYTTLGAARLGDDFKPIEEFVEDEPQPQFFRVQVEMR